MKTQVIAFLASAALMVAAGPSAFAQEGDQAQKSPETAETEAGTESGAEAQPAEAPADAAGAAAEAPAGDETEAGAAGETGQAAPAGDVAAAGQAGQAAGEPATGPGGRPLRTDYPGKEEAKQPSMDTKRIEGVQFEEGNQPDDAYDMRIRELETKVDDLKEKVFQSKSRVVLLKETVLSGNLSGSRAIISHENVLGSGFNMRRALYSLDGSRIFNESDESGSLSERDQIELYNGSITPGNHNLSVLLEFQGSGYGVFSYMEGYKFKLKDSCQFKAPEGKNTLVRVRIVDRGGALASIEERPAIECIVSTVDYTASDVGKASTQTAPKPTGAAGPKAK